MRSPDAASREQPLFAATRQRLCTVTKTQRSQKQAHFLKKQTNKKGSFKKKGAEDPDIYPKKIYRWPIST